MSETYAFQAEINQLLSLIINTFYSNKEVFLRELISNASDALDKVRYVSLTTPEVLGDSKDLKISIIPDKEHNTLIVEDTGIGMTKEELIRNLGTIAHSGTRSFMENLKDNLDNTSLIGQFGVGFYSSYLVAKNVKVITKHNDDKQYIWESSASGSFSVTEDTEGPQMTRGTRIVLELKEDQLDYLNENRIREVVKKHSEFCSFPIMLEVEQEEEIPTEKTDKETEEGDVEDVEEAPKKPETRLVKKFVQLNTQAPIWLRKPEDVKPEEYEAFYRAISNDWDSHLTHKHFSVDGQVQFKSLLFIPKRPPFDMFAGMEKKRHNIKLYVKKVLITDDANTILPDYLAFTQGVIDSDDLPLNVSREVLQQNSIMKVIKNTLVKNSIEMIKEMAEADDKENFNSFYEAFNKNIKLGVHEDRKNRPKLIELLRYSSSKTEEGKMTSLKDYVTRMKEGQTKIYYITGESIQAVSSSPFIEKLKKKGLEVLYMTDPMDEYMTQTVREYDGKELVCCSKEGLELEQTEEEKKTHQELQKEWEPVCNKIKNILDSKVSSVKLSERLADNPCVLVTDKFGWSANMERIMKAQALRSQDGSGMMGGSRKIMEVNPDHPILKEIKRRIDNNENEASVSSIVYMLYQTVLIDSGFSLDEPSKFARQIYRLIGLGLSGLSDMSDDDDDGDDDGDAKDDEDQPVEDPEPSSLMEEVD